MAGVVDGDFVVPELSPPPFGGNTPVENRMMRMMIVKTNNETPTRIRVIFVFFHHIL